VAAIVVASKNSGRQIDSIGCVSYPAGGDGATIGVIATKNTKRHENLCGLTGVESMPANAVFVTFCVFCGF
jgi:hypothetical protein